MNETIVVHKLDETGREVFTYSGKLLEHTPRSLALEAIFDLQDTGYHGIALRRGDRFVETHYTDRWYNIFAIHDVDDGRLKGWYCNITRPARFEDGHVSAEDLALDLVVYPDRTWIVLDEHEFASLSLTPVERQQALEAVRDLQGMALRRQGPFEALQESGGRQSRR